MRGHWGQSDCSVCAEGYVGVDCRTSVGGISPGLIIGIVVPLVLVFAAVAAFLWWKGKRGQRNNSAAPKDQRKPFVVLFTDIQVRRSPWECRWGGGGGQGVALIFIPTGGGLPPGPPPPLPWTPSPPPLDPPPPPLKQRPGGGGGGTEWCGDWSDDRNILQHVSSLPPHHLSGGGGGGGLPQFSYATAPPPFSGWPGLAHPVTIMVQYICWGTLPPPPF